MAIGIEQWILLIPLWLPFIGALIIGLIGTRIKERGKAALGGLSAFFFFVALVFLILLWYQVLGGGPITIWYWPQGAFDATTGATFFYIDFLTVYMAVVFAFLGFFVSIYSIKYMEHDTRLSLFYALLLTLVGGMIGVVMAGDFFTLFILWEVLLLRLYSLHFLPQLHPFTVWFFSQW